MKYYTVSLNRVAFPDQLSFQFEYQLTWSAVFSVSKDSRKWPIYPEEFKIKQNKGGNNF